MKVKINYTVNLEEIPSKADPLIESAKEEISGAFERIKLLKELKDQSIEKCLDEIEALRLRLVEADLMLGDASSMLAGYLHLKTADNAQSEGEYND